MLSKLHKTHLRLRRFSPTRFEKPKANIVDIYQKLIGGQVRYTGGVALVKCCFHEEKTASLALYPQSSSFFCYGCSKGGDLIKFVQEVNHCGFVEALEIIKQL